MAQTTSWFRLLLSLTLLIAGTSAADAQSSDPNRSGQYPLTRYPSACECYPSDAFSKQYLDQKPLWPKGYWRKYTCQYTCVNKAGEAEVLKGTQEDSFRFSDDGRHFICKGFVMKWVETPMNPKRFGFYTLDRAKPFSATSSGIPELQAWARNSGCK
jgi:hypothetical protein